MNNSADCFEMMGQSFQKSKNYRNALARQFSEAICPKEGGKNENKYFIRKNV